MTGSVPKPAPPSRRRQQRAKRREQIKMTRALADRDVRLEYKLQMKAALDGVLGVSPCTPCFAYLHGNEARMIPHMIEAAVAQNRFGGDVVHQFVRGYHSRHLSYGERPDGTSDYEPGVVLPEYNPAHVAAHGKSTLNALNDITTNN